MNNFLPISVALTGLFFGMLLCHYTCFSYSYLPSMKLGKERASMLPPSLSLQTKNDIMYGVIMEVGKRNIWEEKFSLLERFKDREGHCNVPTKHIENGMKLGIWMSNQRSAVKSGKLDRRRKKRMEQLGVVWDVQQAKWDQMLLLLERFKDREGHCNVPLKHIEDGMKLGSWLNNQRKAMKSGKLDQIRQSRMEKLGVVWDIFEGQWEQMFSLLERFKEREGHCYVPQKHIENGIKLGYWLGTQRHAMKSGKLEQSRQRRMEKLGVVWDIFEGQWEKMFTLLKRFKEREGHCNVPQKQTEDGTKLGNWLKNQRQAMKSGKLDQSRQRRIEKMGVVWDVWEGQ